MADRAEILGGAAARARLEPLRAMINENNKKAPKKLEWILKKYILTRPPLKLDLGV